MSSDSGTTDFLSSCTAHSPSVVDHHRRCGSPPLLGGDDFTYEAAEALFRHTLELQERTRPDIHSTMLSLADKAVITWTSQALHNALAEGQRVWLTADLHLGHSNVINYCDRPFEDVQRMNQALVRQMGKVGADEWLLIIGDVAMGDHHLSIPMLREVPGHKVLVLGNHDITRSGACHYLHATNADGSPLFDAVVPFLFWHGHFGQKVMISHYPLQLPERSLSVRPLPDAETPRALPLLNYHGHLHRDLRPHSARIQYVNVGWDVTQGLVCL